MNQHDMSDAMGMTFAEIVGDMNLMDMRVATGASGASSDSTRAVEAMSVDGMKAMDLFSTVPGTGIIETADGTEINERCRVQGHSGPVVLRGRRLHGRG